MKDLEALSLRVKDGSLFILDQQRLPHVEDWLLIESPEQMIECVRQLKVRGAPLIGIAAAISLAQYAEQGATLDQFLTAAQALRSSRPTAVNLMEALDRLLKVQPYDPDQIVHVAEDLFAEDVLLCNRIAEWGQTAICDGDHILTHCNTGGLATAGIGTALGIIRRAFELGKKIHVFVDETRPLLQGGRLTTWELNRLNIPYTLICDNMAASLMSRNQIQKVVVGADRIARNGDFANKVGTYGLAVLCRHHDVPFFVAAPQTTIDLSCENGQAIPIEQRRPEEVRGVNGSFGSIQWAPESGNVYNPAFDVTPAELVGGWILDRGFFDFTAIQEGALDDRP